jgi:hypothetical protein
MPDSLSWLEQRSAVVRNRLDHFERQGNLALLPDPELLRLAVATKGTVDEAYKICKEHERHFPSTAWFAISTLSGLGGLLLLEPTTGSMIITIGGALGAAKSIYDRGAHLVREQGYLGLYWRADSHRRTLAAEMTRRGIRF